MWQAAETGGSVGCAGGRAKAFCGLPVSQKWLLVLELNVALLSSQSKVCCVLAAVQVNLVSSVCTAHRV